MRFDGKTVVITGGASGIGAASARRFHAEGAKVALADLNHEAGEALANDLGMGRAVYIHTDVSDCDAVEELIKRTVVRFGSLDVLLNNAGIGCYGKTPDLDPAEWQRVINIDLSAVFYGCRAAIPVMRDSGRGAIINIASVSGVAGDFGFTAYNAAKGGVINYTRAAAIDHAREGIRINAICPGPVNTPILEGIQALPGARDAWLETVPLGRFAEPEEIASVATFLASDDAAYMTGSIVVVDGGLTAHTGQPNLPALFAASNPD